jgi:uncharacterized OB-fold protein
VSTHGLPAPAPVVNPEAAPYWQAAAEGRLSLQRCAGCGVVVWYPRGLCPECGEAELPWFDASGLGVIYSFTVNRRGMGEYADAAPYVLAYVEIEEGPRMLTNIVGCDPETVAVGDPVRAVFDPVGDGVALVRFAPR